MKDLLEVELDILTNPQVSFKSHQFRALFRKATSLLLRQKANIIIQVITPLIGICIVMTFKELFTTQIRDFAPVYNLQFPFFMNLPYGMIRDPGTFLFTTNCDQV
jgi:hypothetical protein